MRKFVVSSVAICVDCDIHKKARNAESWAKAHAKAHPLHRIFFEKAWMVEAPYKVRLTARKAEKG